MSGQTTGNSGATSQLAANGYRIAKSWQYQDANLPNQNQRENRPLNNNTLRPILMANYSARLVTWLKVVGVATSRLRLRSPLEGN